MDTFITRYTHNGVTYVHDDYNGTTIPADIYDAIMDSRPRGHIRPDHSGEGWIRKMVTVSGNGWTVTGRVTKVSYGMAEIHHTENGKKRIMFSHVDQLTKLHP